MSCYKVFKNFIVVVVLFLCLILVFPGYGYTEGNCAFNPPPQVEFYSPSGQEVRFDNDTYNDEIPLYHLTIPGNALMFEDAIKITYRLEGSLLENAGKILDILNCLQKSSPFNLEVYMNDTLVLNTQVDFSPESVQLSIKEVDLDSDEKLTEIEVLRYIVGKHGLFGDNLPLTSEARNTLDGIIIVTYTPYGNVAQQIHTMNEPPNIRVSTISSTTKTNCSFNIKIEYYDDEHDKVFLKLSWFGKVIKINMSNDIHIQFLNRNINYVNLTVPYENEAYMYIEVVDNKGAIKNRFISLKCYKPVKKNNPPIIQLPITHYSVNEGGKYIFNFSVYDVDSDSITCNLLNAPSWVTLTKDDNGTYTITSSPGYDAYIHRGPYDNVLKNKTTYYVVCSDGKVETREEINETVKDVDRGVTLSLDNCPTQIPAGEVYDCFAQAHDEDPEDNQWLEYSLLDKPTPDATIDHRTGEIRFTAPLYFTRLFMGVTVSDRLGRSDDAYMYIEVK